MTTRNKDDSRKDQPTNQDISINSSPQMGGSRAESKLAGRAPDHPHSRQNMVNDVVNIEGEEEPEFENAGGGLPRQCANQQITEQKKVTPVRAENQPARDQNKRRAS